MTAENPITRRQAVRAAGVAGAAYIAAPPLLSGLLSPATAQAGTLAAKLTPELTEGPYWVNTWGYQITGKDAGIHRSAVAGQVSFETIWPGWYTNGRWTIATGSAAGYRVREKLGFLPERESYGAAPVDATTDENDTVRRAPNDAALTVTTRPVWANVAVPVIAVVRPTASLSAAVSCRSPTGRQWSSTSASSVRNAPGASARVTLNPRGVRARQLSGARRPAASTWPYHRCCAPLGCGTFYVVKLHVT